MNLNTIKDSLRIMLDQKRFNHSLGVKKKAEELANIYDVPVEKASIAGLVHDCGKNLGKKELLNFATEFDIVLDDITRNNPNLLHGEIGSIIAQNKFGIYDKDILNAIRYHTTGRPNMTNLEKVIFLADFIEPNRTFPGVDVLRNEALFDLDKATLMALNHTIRYVIDRGELLHELTIHARNYILIHMEK